MVRRLRGRWWLAAIRPGGKPEGVWALPKGIVAPGERPESTALREVADVRWLPLEDAPRLLAYKGEREMAKAALTALAEDVL